MEVNITKKENLVEYKYIAAIDFGTTYTGFAFAIKGGIDKISDVMIKTNYPGNLINYPKARTLLFQKPGEDNQYIYSWGTSAETEYVKFKKEGRQGGRLFKLLKSDLYDSEREKTEEHYEIKIENGEPFRIYANDEKYSVIDLISELLKLVKKDLFKHITATSSVIDIESLEKYTLWVITVPAQAKEEHKNYMRQAAVRAGIIDDSEDGFQKLIFTFEPEAALLSHVYGGDLNKSGDSSEKTELNICVSDNGGGTADVTARRYSAKDRKGIKLNIIDGAAGECAVNAGSSYLDEEIGVFLEKIFKDIFNDFMLSSDGKEAYYEIKNEWRKLKEYTSQAGDEFYSSVSHEIDITDLWDFVNENEKNIARYGALWQKIKTEYPDLIEEGRRATLLKISEDMLKDMFGRTMRNAYIPLKNTVSAMIAAKKPPDIIYFAGGMSCSYYVREYLKSELKKDFPEIADKLRFVESADSYHYSAAVLYGAVLYGDNPAFYHEHIINHTYGIYIDAQVGGKLIPIFEPILIKGEKMSFDQEKSVDIFPKTRNDKTMKVSIYSTVKSKTELFTPELAEHGHKDYPSLPQSDDTLVQHKDVFLDITPGGNVRVTLKFAVSNEVILKVTDIRSNKTEIHSVPLPQSREIF